MLLLFHRYSIILQRFTHVVLFKEREKVGGSTTFGNAFTDALFLVVRT